MPQRNDILIRELIEQLNSEGTESFQQILLMLLNEAMRLEREHAVSASAYERTDSRRGYANGYKLKHINTRLGRMSVDVPQVRGDVCTTCKSSQADAHHKWIGTIESGDQETNDGCENLPE